MGWLLTALLAASLVAASAAAAAAAPASAATSAEENQERDRKPLRFHSLLQSSCACAPQPSTGDFPTCGCAPIRPSPLCHCTPVTTSDNHCLCVSVSVSVSAAAAPTTTTTTSTTPAAPTTTTEQQVQLQLELQQLQQDDKSNLCSCLPIAGPVCGCSSTLTGRDCNCAPVQHAPGGPCSCIASGSSTSAYVAELIRQLTETTRPAGEGGDQLPRTPFSPQQVSRASVPSGSSSNDGTMEIQLELVQPASYTPLPTLVVSPSLQKQPQPRPPVLQWVDTSSRSSSTTGGAPPAPAASPLAPAPLLAPSILTVASSTLTSGFQPTAPPPPSPCLRPVCLTECRAECPQPIALICIDACQKSCEVRCPAPSTTYSPPTSTITTTTPAPTTTTTISSTPSIPTTNTTPQSTNYISMIIAIALTAHPILTIEISIRECTTRCGDRCSSACAARSLDGCDTLCTITCEASCSLPPPAPTTSSTRLSDSPVVQQLQQQPNEPPVLQQLQLQQPVFHPASAPSAGYIMPAAQQQLQQPRLPAAPLPFFPYTTAALQPRPASAASAPCSLASAPPSAPSPQPTPPQLQQQANTSNNNTTTTIRLTVGVPPAPLAPPCAREECQPECAADCVGAHPAPAPHPSTVALPPSTVVDLGASLVQLCAAVPSCAPGCTPACLEQAASACAPDCVAACRAQCATQAQPAAQCAPACGAVCATTC